MLNGVCVCCNAVRQKVKDLIDMIQDDDRLREERKKAKKNKDKYTGVEGGNRYGGGSSYRYSESLVYFFSCSAKRSFACSLWCYVSLTCT